MNFNNSHALTTQGSTSLIPLNSMLTTQPTSNPSVNPPVNPPTMYQTRQMTTQSSTTHAVPPRHTGAIVSVSTSSFAATGAVFTIGSGPVNGTIVSARAIVSTSTLTRSTSAGRGSGRATNRLPLQRRPSLVGKNANIVVDDPQLLKRKFDGPLPKCCPCDDVNLKEGLVLCQTKPECPHLQYGEGNINNSWMHIDCARKESNILTLPKNYYCSLCAKESRSKKQKPNADVTPPPPDTNMKHNKPPGRPSRSGAQKTYENENENTIEMEKSAPPPLQPTTVAVANSSNKALPQQPPAHATTASPSLSRPDYLHNGSSQGCWFTNTRAHVSLVQVL